MGSVTATTLVKALVKAMVKRWARVMALAMVKPWGTGLPWATAPRSARESC